jgi:hypothetical protein
VLAIKVRKEEQGAAIIKVRKE